MNLKDVLHYYIGCQMIYSSHHEPQKEAYILSFDNIKEAIEFGDRPILRNMDDLTDDEIKELIGWDKLNESYVDVSFERVNFGITVNYAIDAGDQGVHKQSHNITFHSFSPKEWHYLLSNGFDLFQLIKHGLAVDFKTLK